MSQKSCSKCHRFQDLEEFSGHPFTIDGKQSWCKSCTRVAVVAHREANRARINERQRRAYAHRNDPKPPPASACCRSHACEVCACCQGWCPVHPLST